MTKAVIFDMDGVIVDSEKIWHKRFYDFFRHYNIAIEEKELYKLIGAKDKTPIFEEILKEVNMPFPISEIGQKMREFSPFEQLSYAKVLNPGAFELLAKLHKQGIKTALATSAAYFMIDKMLEECHLEGCFDLLVSGELFAESKPNPEIYLYAAKKLGFAASDCIAVEDSPFGIQAAKSAGMTVIAKKDLTFGMDQSQADYQISNLTEVLDILRKTGTF